MLIREDDLGHETQFVLVDSLTSPSARQWFEGAVTNMALGFTRIHALGGWKGQNEAITIYRVASLTNIQRTKLVEYLLANTEMTDLYVVLPGGMAKGYSVEPSVYRDYEAERSRERFSDIYR